MSDNWIGDICDYEYMRRLAAREGIRGTFGDPCAIEFRITSVDGLETHWHGVGDWL